MIRSTLRRLIAQPSCRRLIFRGRFSLLRGSRPEARTNTTYIGFRSNDRLASLGQFLLLKRG